MDWYNIMISPRGGNGRNKVVVVMIVIGRHVGRMRLIALLG